MSRRNALYLFEEIAPHILESKIHIVLRINIHNGGDIVDPITYINIKNVTNWVKFQVDDLNHKKRLKKVH